MAHGSRTSYLLQARPLDADIYAFHYVLEGPPGTDYAGGFYHGVLRVRGLLTSRGPQDPPAETAAALRLLLTAACTAATTPVQCPSDYPMRPPSIIMHTPSGRFSVNTPLCLSVSDFHPESWNPAWSIESILVGLLSFMTGTEDTIGSVNSTAEEKRRLAQATLQHNAKNPHFCALFPELAPPSAAAAASAAAATQEASSSSSSGCASGGAGGPAAMPTPPAASSTSERAPRPCPTSQAVAAPSSCWSCFRRR